VLIPDGIIGIIRGDLKPFREGASDGAGEAQETLRFEFELVLGRY
jgi:hypothetical protein